MTAPTAPRKTRDRRLIAVVVLICLLIAGVASFYASSNPDGLEFVASKTGFIGSATDHHAGTGPFAGYQTKGISNARLSGGIAGVVGVLVVLAAAFGLFKLLARKSDPEA